MDYGDIWAVVIKVVDRSWERFSLIQSSYSKANITEVYARDFYWNINGTTFTVTNSLYPFCYGKWSYFITYQ